MSAIVRAFDTQIAAMADEEGGAARVYFVGYGSPAYPNNMEVLSTTIAELEMLAIDWELIDAKCDVSHSNLPRLKYKGKAK